MKRRTSFGRNLVCLGAGGLLAAVLVGPVSAAPAEPAIQDGHCVMELSAPSPTSGASTVAAKHCFATFDAAMRYATHGTKDIPSGLRPADVTAAMVSQVSPNATVVIGIDWENDNYGGLSRVWEASSGCSSSVSWIVNQIEAAWDNRISSAKGYNNCNRYQHYADPNRTGVQLDCLPNCPTMGIMNDQTSSLWWKVG